MAGEAALACGRRRAGAADGGAGTDGALTPIETFLAARAAHRASRLPAIRRFSDNVAERRSRANSPEGDAGDPYYRRRAQRLDAGTMGTRLRRYSDPCRMMF